MSLKERLAADLKTAMKEKNVVRKNVVQMVRAGVLQIEKDKLTTLDDDGVLDVIAKQLKQRRISSPQDVFLAVCDRNLKFVIYENNNSEN